jgi:Tol biopolymer transport system component
MSRKIMPILLALSLFLASCGTLEISFDVTPASAGNQTLAPASPTPEPVIRLSMDSTSDEIYTAMLESAANWKTIWMDGTLKSLSSQGEPAQEERRQLWLDQMEVRFRLVEGPSDGAATRFRVGDRMTVLEMDLLTGQNSVSSAPAGDYTSQYIPPRMPGMAYPNPISSLIHDRFAEMAFPSDYAQSEGTFTPVAIELIAGRQTLAVDWTYIQSQQPSRRLWLDVEKVVILKMQIFDKAGGGPLNAEYVVEQVVFDAALDPQLFSFSPSTLPGFSDINGKLERTPVPAETEAGQPSEPDPLGEVYFFVGDRTYPVRNIDLIRLPGSCVAGLSACPSPEKVDTPFDLAFSLSPLVWSPDTSLAALTYPISGDGGTSGLFVFNPADDSWAKIAEFPFIDPPLWSPDGEWLAFRVQDGMGSEWLYAVQPDGSGLVNVSDFEGLPAEEAPFVMDGWLGGNLLLRPMRLAQNGNAYRVRLNDGFVEPLFGTYLTKANFNVSPNGQWMAFVDYDYISPVQTLKLLKPGGTELRDLAVFPDGSIQALTWSPDSNELAFIHMTDAMGYDVYVVNPDGSGLRQVYSPQDATTVQFSPDGAFLLVEGMDGTGQHLTVVNLSTLEARLLQAPDLRLDTDWMAASWR